jgi:hypothetical protein
MNALPVGCSIFLLLTVLIQMHQNGTRVFYWDVNGTIKYGTVESTSRMTDVSLCYISTYNNLLKYHICHREPKWSMLKSTAGPLSACHMSPLPSWLLLFFSYCSYLSTVCQASSKLHRKRVEMLIVMALHPFIIFSHC